MLPPPWEWRLWLGPVLLKTLIFSPDSPLPPLLQDCKLQTLPFQPPSRALTGPTRSAPLSMFTSIHITG